MKKGFFGISKEIDLMLQNRIFAADTVDAVLQDNAIILTKNNVNELYQVPDIRNYRFEKISKSRTLLAFFAEQIRGSNTDDLDFVYRLLEFTTNLAQIYPIEHQSNNKKYYPTPDDYFWGGTEEMLIAKGTDWCSEVARVFCALAQSNGVPSRIVYTYSMDDGHVLNEIYIDNQWVLIDSTNGIIYKDNNKFINLSDILYNKKLLDNYSAYYSDARFFQNIGIVDYFIADAENYSYKISFCNDYYRNLLKNVWNS